MHIGDRVTFEVIDPFTGAVLFAPVGIITRFFKNGNVEVRCEYTPTGAVGGPVRSGERRSVPRSDLKIWRGF